jgi:hypothetical protein
MTFYKPINLGKNAMLPARKSDLFFLFIAASTLLIGIAFVHAGVQAARNLPRLKEQAQLVEKYDLTDLALCTEARYTRHPSQADRHAPFQDHPVSLEHFPTGSVIGPVHHLK